MEAQPRKRSKPSQEAPKFSDFMKGMSKAQYDTELDYDAVEDGEWEQMKQSVQQKSRRKIKQEEYFNEEKLYVKEEDTDDVDEDEEECEEDPVDPVVQAEIDKLNHSFKDFARQYRLINKIGEGTFSTVYKAEDLLHEQYTNEWRRMLPGEVEEDKKMTRNPRRRRPRYVAIKKIYVTSSPQRILNELELLHKLTGLPNVVPLITAFRHLDQVVAVLPYCKHTDFREYFRQMTIPDIREYCRSLLIALKSVHEMNIIHRDIKPTNFLYDPVKRQGVLCDFGLAETELLGGNCPCNIPDDQFPYRIDASLSAGYVKNDTRMPRRANRAGTRGFRAPEVLFKCPNQTTKIDIWSVGVILLTILTKRFPFFNSADDVDALLEIATIVGKSRMRACAVLHGCSFETNIPTVGERGFTWEKIVLWATGRTSGNRRTEASILAPGEHEAVQFMEKLFDLDPMTRPTAEEALRMPFLNPDSYVRSESMETRFHGDGIE